jgi:hypothetical protein
MDITNLRGGKIVTSKDTMDSKRKSYEVNLPYVKKRDSTTILFELTSSDFKSEMFDIYRILERFTEEEVREFEIPAGTYSLLSKYEIYGTDTIRVYGAQWIIRIVRDGGFQKEERFMWLYLGLGNDHIRGRPVLLDADMNIPSLPSRFFARDLYSFWRNYKGVMPPEPF